MVSPVARMRWLRSRLYSVRVGTGAAIMPPNVTKILLNMNNKSANGHMGARKFLRECLPRLQFHNPTVDMQVHRAKATTGSATLTVHFSDPSSQPSTVELDLLNRFPEDIMSELVEKTSAKLYSEPPRSIELEDEAEYLAAKRERKAEAKFEFRKKRKANYNLKYKKDQPQGDILSAV
ncbi:hypothetical protein ABW19_dt0201796 [Dactylella cylindrospora]|nr:hypothetical protein ABW19_dt0201796 [Dactylella cylindrospora]